MAHVLTSIPVGSLVYVYANARYRHMRMTSRTGAITILATEGHYPIRVAVRPQLMQRDRLGNLTIGGAVGDRLPGEESRNRFQGGAIDLVIDSPDDWYTEGSPRLNPARHGALVAVKEVVCSPSDATNIYSRVPDPVAPPDTGLCVGFTVTAAETLACLAPHLPGLGYCERHARERGELPAIENACSWRECNQVKHGALPFCFEHAASAGMVQGHVVRERKGARKPKSAKKEQEPTNGHDAPKPKRGAAAHRAGCECVFCSRRGAKLIAAGQAEAH